MPDEQRTLPTMAVLTRTHSQVPAITQALDEAGLHYEELALTGLLTTPEVLDLRAVLALLADPMNNFGALRILSGAKYMLGAADLVGFARWAKYTQQLQDGNEAATSEEPGELALTSTMIMKCRWPRR